MRMNTEWLALRLHLMLYSEIALISFGLPTRMAASCFLFHVRFCSEMTGLERENES